MWGPSEWIALGAVIVAGLSLLIGALDRRRVRRDARAESYRAALYDRQLQATQDLVRIVRECYHQLIKDPADSGEEYLSAAQQRVVELSETSIDLTPEIISAASAWFRDTRAELLEHAQHEEAATALKERGLAPPSREEHLVNIWRSFFRRVWIETGAADLHRQVRMLTGAAVTVAGEEERFWRMRALDVELEARSRGKDR